jgi:hypothetical protein
MLDDIDLKGASPRYGENAPPRLTIHAVDISVRPEIILNGNGKSGPICGAVKIHFPRTFPLSESSAGYVSAVLQEWCKTYIPDDGNVFAPLCFVIDVASQNVYPGAKATTARMKDVRDSCQTIAALWPSI